MRWKPDASRESCVSYYGDMSQLARLRRGMLLDGKGAGVETVDVDTGGGLCYTVLPGRGMDVAWTSYGGMPISYLSKAGVSAPAYHDPRDMQWLKSFFAGLITTCGLSNAGPPCRDELPVLGEIPYGLHGDISNTAADNVCTREEWLPDGSYRLWVSGRMREGRLHGEHLQLRREITSYLGEKKLRVHDVFSNQGDTPQPLTFFYHINIGHPVLDPQARFLAPSLSIQPASQEARMHMDTWDRFDPPTAGYLERQYYHTLAADAQGGTLAALVNDGLELGVCLRFNARQLPCFSQWKVCRRGEYVLAFEPGNCYPWGRERLRRENLLETLEPMQERTVDFTIEIMDGQEELSALRREIRERMNGGNAT